MFKGSRKRKSLIAALVLAVLVIAAVGVTGAYLHHTAAAVTNSFGSADVNIEIKETVENGEKSSVKISNTADSDAAVYIRVAVVANTVNKKGEITGDASDKLTGKLPAEGWTKIGSYYYYNTPVNAGSSTDELLSGSISLEGIKVTILADGIQAYPAKAVTEAWGVTYGQNGPTKAASN